MNLIAINHTFLQNETFAIAFSDQTTSIAKVSQISKYSLNFIKYDSNF